MAGTAPGTPAPRPPQGFGGAPATPFPGQWAPLPATPGLRPDLGSGAPHGGPGAPHGPGRPGTPAGPLAQPAPVPAGTGPTPRDAGPTPHEAGPAPRDTGRPARDTGPVEPTRPGDEQPAATRPETNTPDTPVDGTPERATAPDHAPDPTPADDGLTPAQREALPTLRDTGAGVCLLGPHEKDLLSYVNRLETRGDRFRVVVHGRNDSVQVDLPTPEGGVRSVYLNAREFAQLIREHTNWHGETIELISCETGDSRNGIQAFGAELARELGVTVMAPRGTVWLDADGNFFVSKTQKDELGRIVPGWPPDGDWAVFDAEGTTTVHAEPYPPGYRPNWPNGELPRVAPESARHLGRTVVHDHGGGGDPETSRYMYQATPSPEELRALRESGGTSSSSTPGGGSSSGTTSHRDPWSSAEEYRFDRDDSEPEEPSRSRPNTQYQGSGAGDTGWDAGTDRDTASSSTSRSGEGGDWHSEMLARQREEELDALHRESQEHRKSFPAGLSLVPQGQGTPVEVLRQVPQTPGTFSVHLVLGPDGVQVPGKFGLAYPAGPDQLASLLREDPRLHHAERVELLVDTSRVDPQKRDGYLAELARCLGKEVVVPRGSLWLDSEGNLFASSPDPKGDGQRPELPPRGEWLVYSPDGDRPREHRSPAPPGRSLDWGALERPDNHFTALVLAYDQQQLLKYGSGAAAQGDGEPAGPSGVQPPQPSGQPQHRPVDPSPLGQAPEQVRNPNGPAEGTPPADRAVPPQPVQQRTPTWAGPQQPAATQPFRQGPVAGHPGGPGATPSPTATPHRAAPHPGGIPGGMPGHGGPGRRVGQQVPGPVHSGSSYGPQPSGSWGPSQPYGHQSGGPVPGPVQRTPQAWQHHTQPAPWQAGGPGQMPAAHLPQGGYARQHPQGGALPPRVGPQGSVGRPPHGQQSVPPRTPVPPHAPRGQAPMAHGRAPQAAQGQVPPPHGRPSSSHGLPPQAAQGQVPPVRGRLPHGQQHRPPQGMPPAQPPAPARSDARPPFQGQQAVGHRPQGQQPYGPAQPPVTGPAQPPTGGPLPRPAGQPGVGGSGAPAQHARPTVPLRATPGAPPATVPLAPPGPATPASAPHGTPQAGTGTPTPAAPTAGPQAPAQPRPEPPGARPSTTASEAHPGAGAHTTPHAGDHPEPATQALPTVAEPPSRPEATAHPGSVQDAPRTDDAVAPDGSTAEPDTTAQETGTNQSTEPGTAAEADPASSVRPTPDTEAGTAQQPDSAPDTAPEPGDVPQADDTPEPVTAPDVSPDAETGTRPEPGPDASDIPDTSRGENSPVPERPEDSADRTDTAEPDVTQETPEAADTPSTRTDTDGREPDGDTSAPENTPEPEGTPEHDSTLEHDGTPDTDSTADVPHDRDDDQDGAPEPAPEQDSAEQPQAGQPHDVFDPDIERGLSGEPEPADLSTTVPERYLDDPDFRATDEEHLAVHQLLSRVSPHVLDRIPEIVARDPAYPRIPREELTSLHAYTSFALFADLNRALRTGDGLAEYAPHAHAVASGLRHMPVYEGTAVRRIDVGRSRFAAELITAHYEPGQVVVEPQFLSSSKVDAEHPDTPIPGRVKLVLHSRTGRDVSGVAARPGERECVHQPGSQWLVLRRELVETRLPDGSTDWEWVVELEEITPDSPHHLGPEEVQQRLAERRKRTKEDEELIASARLNSIAAALQGLDDPDPAPEPEPGGQGEQENTTAEQIQEGATTDAAP